MSELLAGNRKEILKQLIRSLHEGADPEAVKERFREALRGVGSLEIARAEEELISEGLTREEVHRLCEVHLAVLAEPLAAQESLAPPGHPIHILMEEHKMVLQFGGELNRMAQGLKDAGGMDSADLEHLRHLEEHLRESESHYVREENVLFPYLEKHGVTQPPAIMWIEHDRIRQVKRTLHELIEGYQSAQFPDFAQRLGDVASSLTNMLATHFRKENSVLFPTALSLMAEGEWKDMRQQFDELGYCCFTPEAARIVSEGREAGVPVPHTEDRVAFETGALSREELEAILNTLPVDITFVDAQDTVRYFNQAAARIFPRSKAVIGRTVQRCHPEKSVHVVNRILEDFRHGRREVAEFWINLQGRLVHIRYFPVRDKNSEYMGTLEVTQDIRDIRRIEGERRLLDDTGA